MSAGGVCLADQKSGYTEGDDLVVNLWRNRGDAVIWSLNDLEKHLLSESGSQQAFDSLWISVQRNIGVLPFPLAAI